MTHQEFRDYQRQLFELYDQRLYRNALDVVIDAEAKFPEKRHRTSFWTACLQTRLGENDRAIKTLRESLRDGVWWSREWLLGDNDLIPLHEIDGFKKILSECGDRQREAQPKSKPGLTVYTPPGYAADGSYPLIVALHGRGTDDIEFAQDWMSALTKKVVLAVPRSSQVMSSETFQWDDVAKSEREIVASYASIRDKYRIDARRVILAGFSQGAALAMYLALKKTVPSLGFIAVAPSLSISPDGSEEWPALIRLAGGKDLRGWISIGDQDPRFQKLRTIQVEMVDRGLQCQTSIEQGVGHDYPREFESKLAMAIDFILNHSKSACHA